MPAGAATGGQLLGALLLTLACQTAGAFLAQALHPLWSWDSDTGEAVGFAMTAFVHGFTGAVVAEPLSAAVFGIAGLATFWLKWFVRLLALIFTLAAAALLIEGEFALVFNVITMGFVIVIVSTEIGRRVSM